MVKGGAGLGCGGRRTTFTEVSVQERKDDQSGIR